MTKYIFFILIVIASRLLPHPDNFTPMGAIALAGGYYFSSRLGLILPLIIMFISDLFLGWHSTMFFVYGSFILITLIGRQIRNNLTVENILATSVLSSLLFFIITNFGVWLTGDMYSKTWTGLVECYYMAIPFFRNTLLGDLFYNGMFYGLITLNMFIISKGLAFLKSQQ